MGGGKKLKKKQQQLLLPKGVNIVNITKHSFQIR